MCEIVDGRTTDGHPSDWYTISSPMSLWLRQAKNIKDPQKKYRLGMVSEIFYWRA